MKSGGGYPKSPAATPELVQGIAFLPPCEIPEGVELGLRLFGLRVREFTDKPSWSGLYPAQSDKMVDPSNL